MKKALRLTALAVVLGAAAFGATAAPITFDFEGLVSSATPKTPTKVDGIVLNGFKFSGGLWAWDKNANDGGSTGLSDNQSGYLVNRHSSGSSPLGKFRIDLELANMYIGSVGFRYYGSGSSPLVKGLGGGGGLLDQFTAATGDWVPDFPVSPTLYSFNSNNKIVSLEIEAIGQNGSTLLGIDDLTIVLFEIPGGTAPEPSSYALVGLALLAAGAARRRV